MNSESNQHVQMSRNQLVNYSLQLAMLRRLLGKNLISRFEYDKIRSKLKKKYDVLSELTVQQKPQISVKYTMIDTHNEDSQDENS